MADNRVSVVIPTYNRRARLARVLAALERQTIPSSEFEVVVVDDGSSDGTSEWLGEQRVSFKLQALRLSNGGPARARNAGVQAALGPLVLFIDDDVEPSPVLLEEHLRSHAEGPDLVVIGPLGSLESYAQPWVAWEQAKVEEQYAAMERGDWEPSFRQFWTGNASAAKAHVLAAGGFDPTFLRAEDIELGVRMQALGVKFRFNAKARTLHHAERSLSAWENAHSSYGKAEVAILGRLGEATMLEVLSTNWANLHLATRWLVGRCLGRPLLHSAVQRLLRSELELAVRVPVPPKVSERACSILANLLYWRASTETLGPERTRAVIGAV